MMYDTGLTSDRMPHTLIYRFLAQTFKAAYEQLQADFPTNEWAQRAYPYRLFPSVLPLIKFLKTHQNPLNLF